MHNYYRVNTFLDPLCAVNFLGCITITDDRKIAAKKMSTKSMQGRKEFMNGKEFRNGNLVRGQNSTSNACEPITCKTCPEQ